MTLLAHTEELTESISAQGVARSTVAIVTQERG